MTVNFKSKGIVIFSPTRVIQKTSINNPCWCILSCDEELSRYYRSVIEKIHHIKLSAPKWGVHITVIREELVQPEFLEAWKQYDRKEISFIYSNTIQTNTKHWWLNVKCKDLSIIREHFGLNKSPEIDYHLTIGWGELKK